MKSSVNMSIAINRNRHTQHKFRQQVSERREPPISDSRVQTVVEWMGDQPHLTLDYETTWSTLTQEKRAAAVSAS